MHLYKVSSKKHWHKFLRVESTVYQNDALYVAPLRKELRQILLRNPNYEVCCWYLEQDSKPVGRVAAFRSLNTTYAGLGFFECINQTELANQLLDEACKWLKERGVEKIEAPVNAGSRERHWGLMISQEIPSSFEESYHPVYYKNLFENYGFVPAYHQYTYKIKLKDYPSKKYQNILARLKKEGLELRFWEDRSPEEWANEFVNVYNQAWKEHEHFTPLTGSEVAKGFEEMKPILDPRLICFVFRDQQAVGFLLGLPDINPLLKRTGSNMNWIGKLKWMIYKPFFKPQKARMLVFGVVPEEQNKGTILALADGVYKRLKKAKDIQEVELSWVGSFNPGMLSFMEKIGAKPYKEHITYSLDI